MNGVLEVGIGRDGREVIINHPDLQPDENGVGHIVFSPDQARRLAMTLLRKADECLPPTDDGAIRVDIVRHLLELAENPRNPWGLKFAAHVIHELRQEVAQLHSAVNGSSVQS